MSVPGRATTTPFRFRWSIVAVGALLLVADALYFRSLAIPDALVSVVSTLRRTSVVLSFFIGTIVFGEQKRLPKAVALGGVLAGIFLILRASGDPPGSRDVSLGHASSRSSAGQSR